MIAVDTSSMIAFMAGNQGSDVLKIEEVLGQKQAVLPPVVLSELLSDPRLPTHFRVIFEGIPVLPITDAFWKKAGLLRAKILFNGFKARLADTLIAQSCLDHDISLITRDQDFLAFAKYGGLKLAG